MAIEGPSYYYINCAKTASRAITQELVEVYDGWRSCEPWQYKDAGKFVFVSVRNPYEPAVEPPGFGQNIATVFKESLNAMVTVAKGGVLRGSCAMADENPQEAPTPAARARPGAGAPKAAPARARAPQGEPEPAPS